MLDVVSYILSKQYIEDTLAGAGALKGKSAYDIACDNGFIGTPSEWLASLKGGTPQIGANGTWIVDGNDTGVIASPGLAGYATEEFVNEQISNIKIQEPDLSAYATREELSAAILSIIIPDVSEFITKGELLEAISNIQIPSLEGMATEDYVNNAIANIEHPIIDLTNYATKNFVEMKCNEILNSIPEPPSYDEIIFDGGEI